MCTGRNFAKNISKVILLFKKLKCMYINGIPKSIINEIRAVKRSKSKTFKN